MPSTPRHRRTRNPVAALRRSVTACMLLITGGITSLPVCGGTPLADIAHPLTMDVAGSRLFVGERTEVFVFTLEGEPVIRFGQEGEGPGEFKVPHMDRGISLHATPDSLLVNSDTKVTFFSHQGRLLLEVKAPPLTRPGRWERAL